uniref:Uncharacterized protein n=1 Tax=Hubei tetragnatha maxillosa virus 9 TaxID=1923251 RepID=A0A1L3KPB5_9VIRU|nr:hypothetical protein 7 [Hubei tetragnatha maxillosa virus 9]APG79189.1 hypothetical protein 6 [Hubei tetragnatha maxillosa virus 9]
MMDEVVRMFEPGPVLAIDPLNYNGMILANKSYEHEHFLYEMACRIDKSDAQLKDLYKQVNSLNARLEFEEKHLLELGQLFRDALVAKNETESSWLGVTSSLFKSCGTVMLLIPGIAPLAGIGTYIFGTGLGFLNDAYVHGANLVLNKNRISRFDNFLSNLGDSRPYSKRCLDDHEYGEMFVDKFHDMHYQQFMIEESVRKYHIPNFPHLIQFWSTDEESDQMVMLVSNFSFAPEVLILSIDIQSRIFSLSCVSLNESQLMLKVKKGIEHTLRCKVLKLTSSVQIFALDHLVRERLYQLPSFLMGFRGSSAELRTAALLFVQVGKRFASGT